MNIQWLVIIVMLLSVLTVMCAMIVKAVLRVFSVSVFGGLEFCRRTINDVSVV